MTGVLVDTSVWVHCLQGAEDATAKIFEELVSGGRVFVNGVIAAELIAGVRSVREREELKAVMAGIHNLEINKKIWWDAEDYRFSMRKRGFTTVLPDMLIAATAIHYDVELFSLDRHFEAIAEMIPLRLFRA